MTIIQKLKQWLPSARVPLTVKGDLPTREYVAFFEHVQQSVDALVIPNEGVTSVDVSGGTTGLNFSGGPVTKVGTLTLSGILAAKNGGTGIASSGAAGNLLTADGAGGWISAAAPSVGGLLYFAESRTVSVPNNVTPAHQFITSGAETNIDFVLKAKGNGAILNQIPDNLVSGGNKRGANAFDLQISRTNNTQVASASNSTILSSINSTVSGGNGAVIASTNGTASGAGAVAIAGSQNVASGTFAISAGNNSVASGNFSAAFGERCTASGINSMAVGLFASTRGLNGTFAHGSGGTLGAAQMGSMVVRRNASTATTITLSTDGAAPTSITTLTLPTDSAYVFDILLIGRGQDTFGHTDSAIGYTIFGMIRRGTSAASTALVGSPVITLLGADAVFSGTSVACSANLTLGSLSIDITTVAKNAQYVAHIRTVEATV
jgi:hypothetical protein